MKLGESTVLHDLEIGDTEDGIILGLDFILRHVTKFDFDQLMMNIGDPLLVIFCV